MGRSTCSFKRPCILNGTIVISGNRLMGKLTSYTPHVCLKIHMYDLLATPLPAIIQPSCNYMYITIFRTCLQRYLAMSHHQPEPLLHVPQRCTFFNTITQTTMTYHLCYLYEICLQLLHTHLQKLSYVLFGAVPCKTMIFRTHFSLCLTPVNLCLQHGIVGRKCFIRFMSVLDRKIQSTKEML